MVLAQKDPELDSLKREVNRQHTDADRVNALFRVGMSYIRLNHDSSDVYAVKALEIAETSRDRKLMARAFILNGSRYASMPELTKDILQAREQFQNAEKTARDNGLDEELAYAYLGLADVCREQQENEKALSYNNQALSIAGALKDDSLRVEAYLSVGDTYKARNEKLLAFRNYLEALTIAEVSGREQLLRRAYIWMTRFYYGLSEFDKALDYVTRYIAIDQKNHDLFRLMDDYVNEGAFFAAKKEPDLASAIYEKSLRLADSLQLPPIYKTDIYVAYAQLYIENKDTVKGYHYFLTHPEIHDFFVGAGMEFRIDVAYAELYMGMMKLDSAYYFLKRAEPSINQKSALRYQYGLSDDYSEYYRLRGDYKQAINYARGEYELAGKMQDIHRLEESSHQLNTLYVLSGDWKMAYTYEQEYIVYRDSLEVLSKASDLLKLEVDNDNRRRERLAHEEEEATQHRHNIQYMGITAGIVILFILLGLSGFFVVHPGTIRALVFFSFILLFEFVIVLTDEPIRNWTHGEPWVDLLVKISLAAILVPLHHKLEHAALHYLTSRKKRSAAGHNGHSVPPQEETPAEV